MSTPTQEIERVISQKSPSNGIPPGYKVCWLHCQGKVGEIFVGKVSHMRFDGNQLTLTLELSPLARVQLTDKEKTLTKEWLPVSPLLTCATTMIFEGCIRDHNNTSTTRECFISTAGDRVGDRLEFSNDPGEITIVEELLGKVQKLPRS